MQDLSKAKIEDEDDVISSSFYGKLSSVISWRKKDGSLVEHVISEKF